MTWLRRNQVYQAIVLTTARILPAMVCLLGGNSIAAEIDVDPSTQRYVQQHCIQCHDETAAGGLNLRDQTHELSDRGNFNIWVKIRDRIESGEMPPPDQPRPQASETERLLQSLDRRLVDADLSYRRESGRAPLRRLTRSEYENTVRDLLAIDGAELSHLLPPDGEAHGFDKHADALDLSYVQMRQYMAAATKALDLAITTFPSPPNTQAKRTWANSHHALTAVVYNGDAHVITADKKRDPRVPVPERDLGGDIRNWLLTPEFIAEPLSIGVLRNQDAAFNPHLRLGNVLAGRYRIRASHWSFLYDRGVIQPWHKNEVAAIEVLSERGERVLHYCSAPPMRSHVTEFDVWLEPGKQFSWNAASLYPMTVSQYSHPSDLRMRGTGYTGPGIALDWIEIEGPFYKQWPPESHRRLFGELPLKPLPPDAGKRLPRRRKYKDYDFYYPRLPRYSRKLANGVTRQIPLDVLEEISFGPFTPTPDDSSAAARKLLSKFLPIAFRRTVGDDEIERYAAIVEAAISANECFENAMRNAYETALCSPSFLYHLEEPGLLNDHALACRLSYFLWNSMPDAELRQLADRGELVDRKVLAGQVERMIRDPRFERFVSDFLDQWLDLGQISATTPDEKLYPEYRPYLADMMVAETRAFYRQLFSVGDGRSVFDVIDSSYAMLNHGVAEIYGADADLGAETVRFALPQPSVRGGLLTQASLLKVTADGTSTSPVRRGVFLLERLLGTPTPLPPPDIPAVDPDVQGATTIRELLEQHRADPTCASCHADIDPPGFALENFDPIGQLRAHYRSTEVGSRPNLVYPNTLPATWRTGPPVDSSGVTKEKQHFQDIEEYRRILLSDPYKERYARNVLQQTLVYATGAEISYADRCEVEALLHDWEKRAFGMTALLHTIIQSDLFRRK